MNCYLIKSAADSEMVVAKTIGGALNWWETRRRKVVDEMTGLSHEERESMMDDYVATDIRSLGSIYHIDDD